MERIEFYREGGQKEGEMNFTYSKDSTSTPKGTTSEGEGMEWLMEIVERMKDEG